MRKIRITKGTQGKNMNVFYKRERLFDILQGFCVIIFADVVNLSFGVRDSQNETQFVRQKTISSHLIHFLKYGRTLKTEISYL